MVTPPSLEGCWEKLRRAEEQLDALEPLLKAYVESAPFEVTSEKPNAEGWRVQRFTNVVSPPLSFGVIVGEIVHDMRSALDHLVWQLVLANGKEGKIFNQFPIADTKPKWDEALARGRLKNVVDTDIAAVERLQPYRRGDRATRHPFAALRELSNTDKHQIVHSAVMAVASEAPIYLTFAASNDPGNVFVVEFMRPAGPLVEGAEAGRLRFRTPIGGGFPDHVDVHGEIAVRVLFGSRQIRFLDLYWIGSAVSDALYAFAERIPGGTRPLA